MIQAKLLKEVRLETDTAMGACGWGLSAWVATLLGMQAGAGLWAAGWLIYPLIVREWQCNQTEMKERMWHDVGVTLAATAVGILGSIIWSVAERQALGILGEGPGADSAILRMHWVVIMHMPVISCVAGALHPYRAYRREPANKSK